MHKLSILKDKINAKMFAAFLALQMFLQPKLAYAADVTLPKTEVGQDGKVTFGDSGGVDLNDGVTKFLSGANQIIAWGMAVAGALMVIIGVVQAYKASKSLQEGDPTGWNKTKNIIIGLIVGGILFAVIGIMIGMGVGFGNSIITG